jgi:endoribonuclease Dicer
MDRSMEAVTLVEVLNYVDFISKPLSKKPAHVSALISGGHSQNIVNGISICDDELDVVAPIAILNTSVTGIGPQKCEILQALTTALANDIVNLERLETLGDSFLKLMSSLYLFQHHKCMTEGELTCLKGKHVGNRNL